MAGFRVGEGFAASRWEGRVGRGRLSGVFSLFRGFRRRLVLESSNCGRNLQGPS